MSFAWFFSSLLHLIGGAAFLTGAGPGMQPAQAQDTSGVLTGARVRKMDTSGVLTGEQSRPSRPRARAMDTSGVITG